MIRFDIDAVIAGIAHVPVTMPSANRPRRRSLGITGACIAAAASVIVALAFTTRSNDKDTAARTTDQSALFAPFVGNAPLFEAQQIAGATLYTAPGLDGDQTCLLIELEEGSSASCGDAELIRSGNFWTKSGFHDGDPQLLTGLVATDVTSLEVNGTDVPVINSTWALFTTEAISSYTLKRADGTTQTVNIQPSGDSADGS